MTSAVTEALAVIAEVEALMMRMATLAARLGLVPGARYRHVRSTQQLGVPPPGRWWTGGRAR